MRSLKHILIVLIIVTSVTTWALTPAIRKMFSKEEAKAVPVEMSAAKGYTKEENALFVKLGDIYNRMSQMKVYLVEGNIRLTDHADTSNSILTPFRYCHKDSLTYYQLGDQEIISVPGLSITVNHSVHKIFMSPRESKGAGPQLFVNKEQLEALKKESYKISEEDQSPLTVIRLSSQTHASCREYRVSYDSAMFIRRVFMRMTDAENPVDVSRDKFITVSVNNWQTSHLPTDLFKVGRYIQRKDDNWEPVAALRNYEVKYIY